MNYREIRIILPSQTAEALSDALMDHGALSSAIEDAHAGTAEEQAIFGEPGEKSQLWVQSLVLALFAEQDDVPAMLQAACDAVGIDVPPYQSDLLADQDWVRATQAQFDPISISDRLWIVPSWHVAPDHDAINIQLDPGLAFGTGSHPTTRLCLRWLDQHLGAGQSVLDYGCGSGILAIAALKLGACCADGIDIDEQAIVAAKSNAEKNQVAAQFRLANEEAISDSYDVVLANILANPLRLLGAMLAAYTKTGGQIVLSGILAQQQDEITEIYAQWFDMHEPIIEEGWCCLSGTKRA